MSHEGLIDELARQLTPVRRLHPPVFRALCWFALVVLIGAGLWPFVDFALLAERLGIEDLCLSYVGAALTTLAAAVAAFETSVPGRRRWWSLLPLPPALLWLGASGMGCLRPVVSGGVQPADLREMSGCFSFILGLSLPLSLFMLVMLRGAFCLRPMLTVTLAGLAAAAGAATLLVLFHPHDATMLDLLVHAAVIALVVQLNRVVGGRLMSGGSFAPLRLSRNAP